MTYRAWFYAACLSDRLALATERLRARWEVCQ